LANPLTSDREYMRRTLMNSLLETVRDNLRFVDRVTLFEVARVYLPQPGQELPEEPRRLGIAMTGRRRGGSGSGGVPEKLDFYDLKGVIETLLSRLRLTDCVYAPAEHPTFQSGRVARLLVQGRDVGVLGEVHPAVRESFDLPAQRVCLAELNLEELLAAVPSAYYYQPVSRFPAVTRDLALVVDETLPAAQLREAIARAGGKLLQGIQLFDVYRGEPIPAGKKSLAYTLTYQAMDRTLTDEDVNRQQTRIQKSLEKELGAQLRA